MVRRLAFALSLVAVLAGCSSAPAPAPTAVTPLISHTPTVLDPTPPASADCPATAELPASDTDMPEMQGVGQGATLFALFFSSQAVAGRQIKVVWRMTGEGALTVRAVGPGRQTVRPVWGPEAHGGSSYQRPGDEWGTGWTFPAAGCWTIEAKRQDATAKLAIRVA